MEKKEFNTTQIGTLIKNKDENKSSYIALDNFWGDVIFRDRETGEERYITHLNFYEPKSNQPDFVLKTAVASLSDTNPRKEKKDVSDLI